MKDTFESMQTQAPDFFLNGTGVFFMNLNDPSSFITVNNIRNRNTRNQSLAMEWIYRKNVGVMIASNMGRPGGACSQVTRATREFEFQEHPNATTQEESVLTFIHRIVKKRGQTNYLDAQLHVLSRMYSMKLPLGKRPHDPYHDPDHDFMVKVDAGRSFNVRDSANPDDYDREFGSVIKIADGHHTNKIYISYIAGPNAMIPRNSCYDAREVRQTEPFLKFDTMFRTISKPAIASYGVFRSMIVTALVASLRKMLQLGYEYAIMASPSSGIYAGHYKKKIQAEYHEVCIKALNETYFGTHLRFKGVIVPKYS